MTRFAIAVLKLIAQALLSVILRKIKSSAAYSVVHSKLETFLSDIEAVAVVNDDNAEPKYKEDKK